MYLDRIQWLIEAIKSAPDDDFDMGYWECGTSHCAGGWLCLDPRAQQLGLRLDNSREVYYLGPAPYFEGATHFRALALFLDISKPNSEYIFNNVLYKKYPIKKSTVLRHIRQVMADEKERIAKCP